MKLIIFRRGTSENSRPGILKLSHMTTLERILKIQQHHVKNSLLYVHSRASFEFTRAELEPRQEVASEPSFKPIFGSLFWLELIMFLANRSSFSKLGSITTLDSVGDWTWFFYVYFFLSWHLCVTRYWEFGGL